MDVLCAESNLVDGVDQHNLVSGFGVSVVPVVLLYVSIGKLPAPWVGKNWKMTTQSIIS
jgi:hypothetical protein